MQQTNTGLVIAAFVVSVCAAVITLSGLVWQLVLYRLQGARLNVQLLFRYRGDDGSTTTISEGRKAPSWVTMNEKIQVDTSQIGIEYVLIRVTNIGRTPVSVESISLDVGRYRLLGTGRYSITPRQFRNHFEEDWKEFDDREPHRLEPGANISVPLHIWPLLASDEVRSHRGGRDLVVRGSATAVGRRPTLSARRYAWRVPKGAVTRFSDHTPPREAFVYRVLWDECYASWTGKAPMIWAREIIRRLEEGASVDDLVEYLDERNKDGIHHLVAYRAHREFHKAPTQPPQPRRSTLQRVLWGVQPGDSDWPSSARSTTRYDRYAAANVRAIGQK